MLLICGTEDMASSCAQAAKRRLHFASFRDSLVKSRKRPNPPIQSHTGTGSDLKHYSEEKTENDHQQEAMSERRRL
jgi:hypothetical protein